MHIRGRVVTVGEAREVELKQGTRTLAEIELHHETHQAERDRKAIDERADAEEQITTEKPIKVTLWGRWAESVEYIEQGMEISLTEAKSSVFRGQMQYESTKDSYLIVEPNFLVDVTAIREWVQCPRVYYLNKLSGMPLKYPVVRGTIVHEVFGDLLRGRDMSSALEERIEEVGLELGLLGYDKETVRDEAKQHASAIERWLKQGKLIEGDEWRSEYTLVSPTFALKGRADALRGGMPVELKTGKNTTQEPRFQDKIQAAAYGLLLRERDVPVDTGTLLYTKNAAIEEDEESGDLTPAKEFRMGRGLFEFILRKRNELAAMEFDTTVPTGFEADARCEYCFEQDSCMVVAGRLEQTAKAGQVGQSLPTYVREYFERMYAAIEAEREAIHEEYRKLWTQSPAERASEDKALIGLECQDQHQLPDGSWEITANIPEEAVSKLRVGDRALASEGNPIAGRTELCQITALDETVTIAVDEPLRLRRLDNSPSEIGVDRMLTALYDFTLRGSRRQREVILGEHQPAFDTPPSSTFIKNNSAQDRAVCQAVAAEDVFIIQGPPGTGKTYTIANIVDALTDRGDRVLVSAYTNRAVDNMLEEIRDVTDATSRRMGPASSIRSDMHDIILQTEGDPQECVEAFSDASVIAATTSTCGSRILRDQQFDTVIIDEAAQLSEPAALAAISLADRAILVGDHKQLPPVVRMGDQLSESLFERLIQTHPEAAIMLDQQYRMNQQIQAFSSRHFYDGELRPATTRVAAQQLADLDIDDSVLDGQLNAAVSYIDHEGSREGNTNSTEAQVVADVVSRLIAAGVDRADIGVIAPFRAQVVEIARQVSVTVDTVDRFQGSAKEVIIISFVASESLEEPIFEDQRRMNVALTRAKKQLVLIGSKPALTSDPFYQRMIDWAGA